MSRAEITTGAAKQHLSQQANPLETSSIRFNESFDGAAPREAFVTRAEPDNLSIASAEINSNSSSFMATHTLPLAPTRLDAPFDAPSLIKPDDWQSNCLQHNLKRTLFLPTALAGIAWGFWFSSIAQNQEEDPLWANLLQIPIISILPHFIPSVLGLIRADEPSKGITHSDVPVTLRWVTRGTENSHNARTAAELAYHKILAANHQNFLLQIITDEKHTDDNGQRIHSFVTLAQSQQQVPDYVDIVVVPDQFITTNRTRKKGRALAYAALRDRYIREADDLNLKVTQLLVQLTTESQTLVSTNISTTSAEADNISQFAISTDEDGVTQASPSTSKITTLSHSLTNLFNDASAITQVFTSANYHPNDNSLGDITQLAQLLHQLPVILNSFNQAEEDEYTEERNVTTPLQALQQWHAAINNILSQFPSIAHTKLDSSIFHLDEESQVTTEVLSGINHFANQRKQNAWRLGQGRISYADAGNRDESTCFNFQSRLCQMLDSIRATDDDARFFWQYQGMHQILFGAKGSFLYLPQLFEQDFKFGFDGGEKTSITEDACMAFNMAAAIDSYFEYLIAEMIQIQTEFEQAFRKAISEPDQEQLTNLPETLKRQLHQLFKKVGLADAYKDDIQALASSLDNQMQTAGNTHDINADTCLQLVKNAFTQIKDTIDSHIHAKTFCFERTLDSGWITGLVNEQSPLTLKEFLMQRKRWVSGLLMLMMHHQYISNARRAIFSTALIGWVLLQLNAIALILPFITLDYASNPASSIPLGLIGSTYLFMYMWGWLHQIHDSMKATIVGIPLMPLVQVAALLFFESVPTWLAICFRDTQFVLVDKFLGIKAFVKDAAELPSHIFQSLANYENYLDRCKEQGEIIPPDNLPSPPTFTSAHSIHTNNSASQRKLSNSGSISPAMFKPANATATSTTMARSQLAFQSSPQREQRISP